MVSLNLHPLIPTSACMYNFPTLQGAEVIRLIDLPVVSVVRTKVQLYAVENHG